MKKTKILSLFLAIAMTASILAGCQDNSSTSNGSDANKPPSSQDVNLDSVDNELTMKIDGEIDKTKTLTTLIDVDASPAFNGNPFDEVAGVNWSIHPFIYDYLAFFSPTPERTFKSSLMESYDYAGEILTIKLLPDLKWSDGTVLNAEDVLVNYYCGINAPIWSYIEKMEKIDDLTIKITFCKESQLLLNLAFNTPIRTPDEIYGKYAEEAKNVLETGRVYDEVAQMYKFTEEGATNSSGVVQKILEFKPKPTDVVCSGAYVIDKHNTSEILFKINPEYRKEPLITAIRGLRPGDSQAFSTALLASEYTIENGGLNVDMSKEIDSKYKDTLRKVFIPEMSQIGYSMNTQKYPLDNVEVRKAIAFAIDRENLLAVAEPGSFAGSKVNAGLIPSLETAYTDKSFVDSLTNYDYNPDEATRLLESIGWKKEGNKWVDDKGESPVITIGTINSWPSFMMTGEAMSQMLTDFGFNIEFKPMEFGVWNDFTKSDEKMIVCSFVGGAASYAHPWECFNDLFNVNTRMGWQKFEPGADKIFLDPVENKEYNVTNMLSELYGSSDPQRTKEITHELMKLTSNLCGYISVIDKSAPLRVYDPKLSLTETDVNTVQQNYMYYGNINNVLGKMIFDDELYFIK